MSQANIFKFIDRFLPSTVSRLYLADVPIKISSSKHQLHAETDTLPIIIYFQLDGEFWQIHPLQSYKDVVTPFLLPLQFQHCADFHVILCSVKQYEKYPTEITDIWRKYGYGVIVIDTYTEPPVKLIDYPLCQFVFPEIRRQVQGYVQKTKGIEFFREPFWIKNTNLKERSYTPAPELISLIKSTEVKSSENKIVTKTFHESEILSYEKIFTRLQKNESITVPEQQGFVLYIFKKIENTLKTLLPSEDDSSTDLFSLIDNAYEKQVISEDMKNFLHSIRKGRNSYVHNISDNNPLSNQDLLRWYRIMIELEKIIPQNEDSDTNSVPIPRPKAKLTKTMLKKLPKQENKKLAYGQMRKQIASKAQGLMQTRSIYYNAFISKILAKYKINEINNPKIISVLLADRIGREIDTEKLAVEIETCCKDLQPDSKNYPLLASMA